MKKTLTAIAIATTLSTPAIAWDTTVKTDEMTGIKSTFHWATATDGVGQLLMRERSTGEKDMIWITGDSHICANHNLSYSSSVSVTYKIDDEEVVFPSDVNGWLSAGLSTSNKAVFLEKDMKVENPEFDLDTRHRLVDTQTAARKAYIKENTYTNGKALTAASEAISEYEKEFPRYITKKDSMYQKIKTSAKQLFLRIHDGCGTETTQKFILN